MLELGAFSWAAPRLHAAGCGRSPVNPISSNPFLVFRLLGLIIPLSSFRRKRYIMKMQKVLICLLGIVVAGCARMPQPNSSVRSDGDAAFDWLAKEYMAGFLEWRPQTGTALGFHQYDGKVTDLSRPSLD